uniref:WAP domain-containing protein n=1 Tax=Strigamia maritima TaxID=126957 RepID=T1J307_STRMM
MSSTTATSGPTTPTPPVTIIGRRRRRQPPVTVTWHDRSSSTSADFMSTTSASSKPGSCPAMGLFGPFCASCTADTQCPGMQKCCPAGNSGRNCCSAVFSTGNNWLTGTFWISLWFPKSSTDTTGSTMSSANPVPCSTSTPAVTIIGKRRRRQPPVTITTPDSSSSTATGSTGSTTTTTATTATTSASPKPGTCPSIGLYSPFCASCTVDTQCPGIQKCCAA